MAKRGKILQTTAAPTIEPTVEPTEANAAPTVEPTVEPTEANAAPTAEPTVDSTEPTVTPTAEPTVEPTEVDAAPTANTTVDTTEADATPTAEPAVTSTEVTREEKILNNIQELKNCLNIVGSINYFSKVALEHLESAATEGYLKLSEKDYNSISKYARDKAELVDECSKESTSSDFYINFCKNLCDYNPIKDLFELDFLQLTDWVLKININKIFLRFKQ